MRNDIFAAAKMTEIQRNEAERHREVMELLNEGLDEPEMARDTDFETVGVILHQELTHSITSLQLSIRRLGRRYVVRSPVKPILRSSTIAQVLYLSPYLAVPKSSMVAKLKGSTFFGALFETRSQRVLRF